MYSILFYSILCAVLFYSILFYSILLQWKENRIFYKKDHMIMSQICLHMNSDEEIVQNLKYFLFIWCLNISLY